MHFFDLSERLSKQNEVLMLQPPLKPRRIFTDILSFFKIQGHDEPKDAPNDASQKLT